MDRERAVRIAVSGVAMVLAMWTEDIAYENGGCLPGFGPIQWAAVAAILAFFAFGLIFSFAVMDGPYRRTTKAVLVVLPFVVILVAIWLTHSFLPGIFPSPPIDCPEIEPLGV